MFSVRRVHAYTCDYTQFMCGRGVTAAIARTWALYDPSISPCRRPEYVWLSTESSQSDYARRRQQLRSPCRSALLGNPVLVQCSIWTTRSVTQCLQIIIAHTLTHTLTFTQIRKPKGERACFRCGWTWIKWINQSRVSSFPLNRREHTIVSNVATRW